MANAGGSLNFTSRKGDHFQKLRRTLGAATISLSSFKKKERKKKEKKSHAPHGAALRQSIHHKERQETSLTPLPHAINYFIPLLQFPSQPNLIKQNYGDLSSLFKENVGNHSGSVENPKQNPITLLRLHRTVSSSS